MIRLLFAVAVGLFVLSLPILGTPLGVSLRRAAAFCFVLALVPSIVLGLFFPGSSALHPGVHPVALLVGGVVLIVASYLVLRIRSSMTGAKDKPFRISEKTPLDRTRHREQDFFAFLADQHAPPEEER